MEENIKVHSRRKFLAASAACFASAGIASLTPLKAVAETTSPKEIIYRQLGKTGLKLPIVSMGAMNINSPGIVEASYDLGVRHFDTAAGYQRGRNEKMLGKMLLRLGVRDNVVIASKELRPAQRRDLRPEEYKTKLVELCEGSLKRLKTDYIDIFYVHSVASGSVAGNTELMEGMELLKKQGKIRFSGLSTHENMAEVINEAAKGGFYDVLLTSFNFTLADDALLGAIKNAASKGIGIVAMKTMAGGPKRPDPEEVKLYGSSTFALGSLKWALRNENIATVIAGYDSYEHMNEDFSVAYDLEYTLEERKFLTDNDIKLSLEFCRQCRKCLVSCPHKTDIPTLMRTHMYAAQYGNFYQARETLEDMRADESLAACGSCNSCVAECVNSVNIPRKIDELKLIYG